MSTEVKHGDCLEILRSMESDSVDLVFTSPPYEAARTYGIGFNLRGQDWVDWSVQRYIECVRVCRGLVCWVVEGQTKNFRWSATPALLMADLHRAGVRLRKPPAFYRKGVCGSGGPDWWSNDYEFCVCSTKGRLPWSDNTATGKPCKFPPGGRMSNRHKDGQRINSQLSKKHTKRNANGKQLQTYHPPELANPGNVIRCKVGGGRMGSMLAHENEAPFPESLVEPFIRCFCPPKGVALDPFCGSGTTLAVAKKLGRNAIGIDVRESQVSLTCRRLFSVQPELTF